MNSPTKTGIAVGAAVFALLAAGSLIYWIGEGRPGTPEDFRQRVEATGLSVDWEDNGPTGGSGFVAASCGSIPVSINELDGALTITWEANSAALTPETSAQILACPGSAGYRYFGSVQLAQGATLELSIDAVLSADDVTVLQSPAGVQVRVSEASDGTARLTIDIGENASPGSPSVLFAIAGEPEPVQWTFTILQQ